jgi:hypothetical protein
VPGARSSHSKSTFRCAVASSAVSFVEEFQTTVITRISYDSVHHVGIGIAIAIALANYGVGTNIRTCAE